MKTTNSKPHPLPCVVQLGFAGSRRLFTDDHVTAEQSAQRITAVERYLFQRLIQLRGDLKLQENHFFVGISQLACGADTLFARVCERMEPQPIPQRIFLPQPRAMYLAANGSDGTPDFSPEERATAEALLSGAHIIQEQVTSQAMDRTVRFKETNVEILRVSDVLVCLLRDDATGQAGGTNELLEQARKRGTPTLEIRVGMANGQPTFREQWHNLDGQNPFQPPQLPRELAKDSVRLPIAPLPSSLQFCEPLKNLVSSQAKWHQRLFKFAAVAIIAAHIAATICATLALGLHGHGDEHDADHGPGPIPYLLAVEVVFLLFGFGVHWYLHKSHAARIWALARLVAELARSQRAIPTRHLYLSHLFRLHLPHRFRPLLRTLNVLHLRSTWTHRNNKWQPQRDQYLKRVDEQIDFYRREIPVDRRRLAICQWIFSICSSLAIFATGAKLIVLLRSPESGNWLAGLGGLAIVLPVFAVGGMSWAAALDCEARRETFGETLHFLERQRDLLADATLESEFDQLLLETETVLLGETANWYSRRAYTSVA